MIIITQEAHFPLFLFFYIALDHHINKSMMQSELLVLPSWPSHSYFHSIQDQHSLETNFYAIQNHDLLSAITPTPEHSSPIPSFSNKELLSYDDMEGFDDVCRWLCDDDDQQMESEIPTDESAENSYVWSPTLSMNSTESHDSGAMEIDSQTGIQNLLTAYAEAMGLEQRELAKVIQKCIREKASPIGPTIERLAHNLFPCADNQGQEYLKQESIRNFKTAFRGFYEIFPYGRFAHFTANSAILEAVPPHVDSVQIVDFDMGEGSQWPVVIQAMGQRRKSLTITSVKLEDDISGFEKSKRHLVNYARSFGVDLKVEEKELGQIPNGNAFMVFNCMVGLPHMGRTRRRNQVMEFLKLAKGLLTKNEGIITFGDGEDGESIENYSNYPSFFDGKMAHYKALYESMEWGFPSYLNEGRIVMETLFVAPFISSMYWLEKWEEGREHMFLELKGQKMSRESRNEVRELVKDGENPYKIRVEGDNENEMVLEWKGIPLVRVSAWIS